MGNGPFVSVVHELVSFTKQFLLWVLPLQGSNIVGVYIRLVVLVVVVVYTRLPRAHGCATEGLEDGGGFTTGGGRGGIASDAGSRLAGTSATAHAMFVALVSIHGRKCVIRPS